MKITTVRNIPDNKNNVNNFELLTTPGRCVANHPEKSVPKKINNPFVKLKYPTQRVLVSCDATSKIKFTVERLNPAQT